MHATTIRSHYYQQFDMDGSLDVPAEGAGGWKQADLTFDRDRTAVVVMHAVDCLTPDELPWLYRSTEYLRRANVILQTVFEPLLSAVRAAGMRLYHVVPGGIDCQEMSGFQRAVSLGGSKSPRQRLKMDDPLMDALQRFRLDHIMPGAHNYNIPAAQRKAVQLGFSKQAAPQGDEGVVETSEQLYALCEADGINHLVYCGFTINWCILTARGGMVDMSRSGLMCSTIRQAVTAIENKESARSESHKEEALWRVSLDYGFVFDLDDFVRAIA